MAMSAENQVDWQDEKKAFYGSDNIDNFRALADPQLAPDRSMASANIGTIQSAVAAILAVPDAELNYEKAKLAIHLLIDPEIDNDKVIAQLDRLAASATALAGPAPDLDVKLNALRKLIYQSGSWNDYRPLAYDHENYRGLRSKLISSYLETRRGNCVSMPLLFVILAERLGLAMAPQHLLVRYRDAYGRGINLEATSGANPARDEWLRQTKPMSDRALASGLYLRLLPKREGIAVIAAGVLQKLMDEARYEEAMAVCKHVLRHNPRDGITHANLATASHHIIHRDFRTPYGAYDRIPPQFRVHYEMLWECNITAVRAVTELGWEPPAPQ